MLGKCPVQLLRAGQRLLKDGSFDGQINSCPSRNLGKDPNDAIGIKCWANWVSRNASRCGFSGSAAVFDATAIRAS